MLVFSHLLNDKVVYWKKKKNLSKNNHKNELYSPEEKNLLIQYSLLYPFKIFYTFKIF